MPIIEPERDKRLREALRWKSHVWEGPANAFPDGMVGQWLKELGDVPVKIDIEVRGKGMGY